MHQQVISASLRMNLVRAAHFAIYESYNRHFGTVKMDCARCTDRLRMDFCALFDQLKDNSFYELI